MPARIRRTARRLEDRGASAVEYGLMVAAIAAVIVGVVFGLGTLVRSSFDKTCQAIAAGDKLDPGSCDDAPAAPVAPPGGAVPPAP